MSSMKKVPASDSSKPVSDPLISALVEPLPGHSDDEVIDALQRAGAKDVALLSPGFISAIVGAVSIPLLERVASVHPKRQSQMRS